MCFGTKMHKKMRAYLTEALGMLYNASRQKGY